MFETNNSLPLHIAIIMDGNGRWAAARGLPRSAGHREGAQAVRRTLEAARDMGIKYLTLYAFSTENWTRPKEEINTLMQLLERTLDEYQKSAQKADYRVLVSGERERLPAGILAKMDELVRSTESNKGLTVHLALNYGARQEIVHAVNQILKEGLAEVTPQDISRRLYQPEIPEPDLIIRTSGEQRLSNFLLWQAAYSEFYFTPVLWPDFNKEELQKAVDAYRARKRRFGGI
ncbi:MAG TPA: isoprenyl transferase [Candidatus Avelusimicrobium excrementipullorum]|nr:isoprenyl transferase [Candidatus Avelusimicrobium excrementipullorum]